MAVPFMSSGVPQRCAGMRSVYWLVDGFVLLSDVFCKFRIHQTTPFVNSCYLIHNVFCISSDFFVSFLVIL